MVGAGPLSLQNVCRLDLPPRSVGAYEGVGGIAAEEAVLLVVPPHEVEVVVGRKLVVAANRKVTLMIGIGGGCAVRIAYREDTFLQVVKPPGAEEPPPVFDKRTAEVGGDVARHDERCACADRRAVINRVADGRSE